MNGPLRHHLNAMSMSVSTSRESARACSLIGLRIPPATIGDTDLNSDVSTHYGTLAAPVYAL